MLPKMTSDHSGDGLLLPSLIQPAEEEVAAMGNQFKGNLCRPLQNNAQLESP